MYVVHDKSTYLKQVYSIFLLLALLVPSVFSLEAIVLSIDSLNNYNYSNLSIGTYLEIIIGNNVTNLGSKPVNISETDILIFDYPLNTSSQHTLKTKFYIDGYPAKYVIEYDREGNPKLKGVINRPAYLDVNESISVYVKYIVYVNITQRILEIKNLGLKQADNWDEIVIEDKELVNTTGLWNYTNPLVKLLIDYIKAKHNETPLAYLLGALNWIDENIVYSTRFPPRHPWETIVYGEGDCDDQSNLLITLLRGVGIPSYLEIGLVYLNKVYENYTFTSVEAGGYLTYYFYGGGTHGWVVAYIPPWGYIRIDLTSGGKGLEHIVFAAYYTFYGNIPTVVIAKIVKQDYVEQTTSYIKEVQEKKLKYNIYLIMKEIPS